MTLKNVDVSFPDKGLVLVTGHNQTTNSMDSCGSGKTALGEILCRTLFGVRGRYAKTADFSTHKKGKMLVEVDCDLDGRPLKVISGYKHKDLSTTGEGLKIVFDGQPIEHGHLDGTREELQRLVKVTPGLASWSVFIDGDKLNFTELNERRGAELLLSALSQGVSWDGYNEHARTIYNNFQTQLTTAESSHATAKTNLAMADQRIAAARQDIKQAEANYAAAQRQQQQKISGITSSITSHDNSLKGYEQRLAAIKKEIAQIEKNHAARFAELEQARLSLEAQQTQFEAEYMPIYEDWAKKDAAEAPLAEQLREFKKVPKVCPVCAKPWDKAVGDACIKEAEEKLVAAQAATVEALRLVNVIDSKRRTNTQQLNAVRKDINSLNVEAAVRKLSDEYANIEEHLKKADQIRQNLVAQLQAAQSPVSDSEIASKTAVLHEREDHKIRCEEDLAASSAATEELRASLGVIQYWTKAFGPTGIPNMLIDEAILPLNASAQRISEWLTGGLITVTYSTTKKLATGADKASLDIKVDNKFGSSTIEGSSKGEAGMCNLIVAESISEVGSIAKRVGFRWYDEILNAKDELVRRSILNYLKELAERHSTLIFIVDHHPETASYVDHILTAEKGADGWTTFAWR